MVEYGNGVGQATEVAGGGGGHAAQNLDAGAAFGQFISSSVHTISTMPPAQLIFIAFVVIAGLFVLKRVLL